MSMGMQLNLQLLKTRIVYIFGNHATEWQTPALFAVML